MLSLSMGTSLCIASSSREYYMFQLKVYVKRAIFLRPRSPRPSQSHSFHLQARLSVSYSFDASDMSNWTASMLHRHIIDVRKACLDLFEKIPWEMLEKNMEASFGSLKRVLLHTLDAYRYWFDFAVKDHMASTRHLTLRNSGT